MDARSHAVELEAVTKRFGEVTAVHRVDLHVEDGEFFSLLGPSGCGNTTTLRMIAGHEVPSAAAGPRSCRAASSSGSRVGPFDVGRRARPGLPGLLDRRALFVVTGRCRIEPTPRRWVEPRIQGRAR